MALKRDSTPLRLLVCRVGETPNSFETTLTELGIGFDAFEAIHLVPLNPTSSDLEPLQNPGSRALYCFVSANAVRFAKPYLESVPRSVTVAAVGQKTASALKAMGFSEVLTPAGQEDSEGLLATLNPSLERFDRAFIIKGEGGREALREGLKARGLHVTTINLYRRQAVLSWPRHLSPKHWAGVCAMSNEVISATLNAFGAQEHQALCSIPWILTHERQAEFARNLGISHVFVCRPHPTEEFAGVMAQLAESYHEQQRGH